MIIHHQRRLIFIFIQISKILYNVKKIQPKQIKKPQKHNKSQINNPSSYLHNTLLLDQAKILKDLIYAVAWTNTDLLPTEVNEFNKTSKGISLGYLLPLQAKNEKVK